MSVRVSYLTKRKKTLLPMKTTPLTLPFPRTRTRAKNEHLSPEDLPREDIIHDLSDTEKICPHDGATLKHIGEETSE